MHRLVPNIVILRLAPGQGSELRAAALEAATHGPELLLAAPLPAPLEDLEGACAALGASAASGAFGPRELALLQQYLDASAAAAADAAVQPRAPVKELVARARLEGLGAEARAAAAAAEGAGAARRAALRLALQRSQEEAEYSRMLGRRSAAAAAPADAGLRALAPQAALGGGLLLALGSATLLGYCIGRNMFGEGSDGAWVLALAFGAATLVLEATLLLLRLGRQEGLEAARARQRERETALVRSRAGAAANAAGSEALAAAAAEPAAGEEGAAGGSGEPRAAPAAAAADGLRRRTGGGAGPS
jgi:hypothetical protein